ncbi:unnamed protein product [Orchesella dallaii]|uniref:UDP-D-xylose:beta-D-glucoside alpha-1,3-D-xylosyltransferase n=1 Tax=Orchesella dallaii TaxID=48710 RepID=A0ABP1QDD9_9HEXA
MFRKVPLRGCRKSGYLSLLLTFGYGALLTVYLRSSGSIVKTTFPEITNYTPRQTSLIQEEPDLKEAIIRPEKNIRIGIISGVPETQPLTTNQHSFHLEAVALINSVIISTIIYPVDSVEIFFFVNRLDLVTYFEDHIRSNLKKLRNYKVAIITKFDLFYQVLPEEYQTKFSLHEASVYLRLFIPEVLPNVEKLMYLDTDLIITGSLWEMWNQFNKMNSDQLIAIAHNNEENDRNYGSLDHSLFHDIPHVDAKGVNGGVQLMNLEKLRKFNYTTKCLEVLKQYQSRGNWMDDQRVVNIVFNKYRNKLKILPCRFNFQHIHCDMGLTCNEVERSPIGIHVIHGAGGKFESNISPFYEIYHHYLNHNFENGEYKQLFSRIKTKYSTGRDVTTCFGNIGQHLYKNVSF